MRARRRYFISVVSALALFLVVREPAAGQVTVVGQQDLTFGVVIPGTPTVVAPTDAAGTGLALAACGSHALGFTGSGLQTRRVWVGGSIGQAAIDAAAATSYSGTITLTLIP